MNGSRAVIGALVLLAGAGLAYYILSGGSLFSSSSSTQGNGETSSETIQPTESTGTPQHGVGVGQTTGESRPPTTASQGGLTPTPSATSVHPTTGGF